MASETKPRFGKYILTFGLIGFISFLINELDPSFWPKAKVNWYNFSGWTDSGRKTHPIEFLQFAKKELQINIKNAQSSIQELKHKQEKAKKFAEASQTKVYKISRMLDRLVGIYHKAKYPVTFASMEYNQDEFTRQVKLIWSQKKLEESNLRQLQTSGNRINNLLPEMQENLASAKLALNQVETSISIAETEILRQELLKIIDDVKIVVDEINGSINLYDAEPIPDPGALLSKKDIHSAKFSEDEFEAFLKFKSKEILNNSEAIGYKQKIL